MGSDISAMKIYPEKLPESPIRLVEYLFLITVPQQFIAAHLYPYNEFTVRTQEVTRKLLNEIVSVFKWRIRILGYTDLKPCDISQHD